MVHVNVVAIESLSCCRSCFDLCCCVVGFIQPLRLFHNVCLNAEGAVVVATAIAPRERKDLPLLALVSLLELYTDAAYAMSFKNMKEGKKEKRETNVGVTY